MPIAIKIPTPIPALNMLATILQELINTLISATAAINFPCFTIFSFYLNITMDTHVLCPCFLLQVL